MNNIKLVLAYDGGEYLGWQKTKEGPSIEETLQNVLEQILQHPVQLQAASRTDAGVHALGQIVNFVNKKPTIDLNRLCISLNSLLPSSIVALHAEEMPQDFHPTLDCIAKEYHYWVCYGSAQLPQNRFYSWHYPHLLDIEAMREGACYLIGQHNFQAFCNDLKNAEYEDYIREVASIEICPWPEKRLQIIIRGNHFLYKMMRNLTGTLVYVGRGKINSKELPEILASMDRKQAGVTAPAHGLTLYKVFY